MEPPRPDRLAMHATAMVRAVLVGLVRVYQYCLRPVLGPNCRFVPSCSDYAIQALTVHGPLRGSGLAAGRILRCNPWHAGGHDPVPGRPATPCSCGMPIRGMTATSPSLDRDRPVR